jgi:sulfate transport system ATP-binding protein/putative spermidine/putrescine transport system ATP-binding protein
MSLVENLIRDYGDFKVEIPRWEIADQGVTALWGPSGSGKTSVFRLLAGLEPCPGLTWTFKGEDLARLAPPDRRIGVVFQSFELFPHMSAEENILFAARARRIPEADARKSFRRLIESLRMESYVSKKAAVLSGGEAQRVALARAVIGRPRILFLDEPFSSLDAELRERARLMTKSLIQELQIPTLLVTHDQNDLDRLADVTVKIRDGRLL